MTFNSLWLILTRQFKQKWGRFLLASGGIMIGIWAIVLTTSLSLGVSQTIITALNSQSLAKRITVQKEQNGKTDLLSITEAPKLVPVTVEDLDQLKNSLPAINQVTPSTVLTYAVRNPQGSAQSCLELNNQIINQQAQQLEAGPRANRTEAQPEASNQTLQTYQQNCIDFNTQSQNFNDFYEGRKGDWFGSTAQPERGEFVSCFRCGALGLNDKLGVSTPEEMVGKQITIDLKQSPEYLLNGQIYDTLNPPSNPQNILQAQPITLEIVAVVDDRESLEGTTNTTYLDFSYFQEAIGLANEEVDETQVGYLSGEVFINSYDQLDSTIQELRNRGYLATSLVQILIQSVQVVFNVLTAVLSLFGLIALIASIFGIVNVMTISVLERQKEIGVLKSLGARDGDIFNIFIIESALLGFLGWLLGVLLAFATGSLISAIFIAVVNSNPDWRRSLENVNINDFNPSFPWWLLLGSLALALFFTIISGVFPALKAGKQNPVEVLRAE